MARSVKRKRACRDAPTAKRPKATPRLETPVKRDLLEQYYPHVQSLRQYLLAKLPGSSRLRRKKIAALGQGNETRGLETRLAHILDTILVCTPKQGPRQDEAREIRWQQWLSFSQGGDESYVTLSGGPDGPFFSQSEIVDFVIWLLFSRQKKANSWPKHLLCDGYRKVATEGEPQATTIPDVFSRFPNSHVKTLKESPWPQVLALLGQCGERVMIDLLVDCSVFVAVQAGVGNYHQLSGFPLSELDLPANLPGTKGTGSTSRKPSEITLIRSRIFYSKPALTARGLVQAGFKHIHVLNRCPYVQLPLQSHEPDEKLAPMAQRNEMNTVMVMMYIFPRQFGLHNVFVSEVDRSQTAQKFQDYTLREGEIAPVTGVQSQDKPLPKIPRRLRGAAKSLTQRLQVRHGRCSYVELLRHYCPCAFDPPSRSPSSVPNRDLVGTSRSIGTPGGQTAISQHRSQTRTNGRRPQLASQHVVEPGPSSVVEHACAVAHVSAFCQAVLSKIIPDGFWGEGDTMEHNKKTVLRRVDHFIKLRRFETMSLHEIIQDCKVVDIPWLQQPHLQGSKTSQTDMRKRHEIFHEFLYYVFDSLLIPLLRSNFYVSESNTHRYQIYYFRHEVWKWVAEPAMATLKETMFEEVKVSEATSLLQSRLLGCGHVRLLPKKQGLRPIMNLRRRTLARGSSKILGPSINAVLGPVQTLLKFEKSRNPSKLGSTMFSVNDIYSRLKEFKASLGPSHAKLYFAKLDVHAAFDTIPQEAVVKLMASVPSQNQYTVTKHAEVRPGERPLFEANKTATKPIRRWHATAMGKHDSSVFMDRLERRLGGKKKNTVFVDSAVRKTHSTGNLIQLLAEHVTQNLVKVGKKYYRQKTGIPQGSILSSLLCNYFYADMEMRHLGFLGSPDCLLLRLIDDFLLITLDRSKAERFVETMHRGLPEYGVEVNPRKTLVNFDMEISRAPVQKIARGNMFPYCGTLIDCQTLEITKDRDTNKHADIANSLTIEFGRSPGQNFQRKVLNAFKIQSHLMFFDTTHNTTRTVLDTLHRAFSETAGKMWAYIRCMPKSKRPGNSLVIRTIIKVIDVAFLLLTGKSRRLRYEHYSCDVRKGQVAMAACKAFTEVLSRKQANFNGVLGWLRKEITTLATRK